MSFIRVLEKYRQMAFSERDKGDRFERLMKAYLQTDPKYAYKFKTVWLWNEFPGRRDLGGSDTGIDLVALTHEGDYWAIQCKCYQETSRIDKPEVDSFLATSSREFLDEDLQTTRFAHRLWISTTNNWSANAEEAIRNQNPPVTRINLYELMEAPVDWEALEQGIHGEEARRKKHDLKPHQKLAIEKAHEYFKEHDRGKLIMACGTGKTFTALKIAERETEGKGTVLFLVPSIALLGQTLREWSAHAEHSINAIAICSDPKVSQQRQADAEDTGFSVVDLAYPASTDPDYIVYQFEKIRAANRPGMTVVFSTYQSTDVVARAQKAMLKRGFPEFDLIICDEAHRTTGVALAGKEESAFIKVHDPDFIRGKKRLYMTATPRLYSDDAKGKAAEADVLLCSMDDPNMYGEEIYRLGFGEAVEKGLLTDYKVIILTLNDNDVPLAVQRLISGGRTEINTDDLSKIIGTVNALSKQFIGDDGVTKATDPAPMRRAVAFCSNISASKQIAGIYNEASDAYISELPEEKRLEMVNTHALHMDGTMTAPERDRILAWLKEKTRNNECRIITNVRVLSEGVDVPSLDAVLFLSARNSQIDVVQSVGRVMRKAENKKYGYIIIPVIVPADVEPEVALSDNERFKVVWSVLNALRAHDDRFNATVNKIELNRRKPDNILIGRPEYTFDADGALQVSEEAGIPTGRQLSLQFEELQSVIYARMVQRVGERRYWEQWAKDVAVLAERQIERITSLVHRQDHQREAFGKFVKGLRKNINPSITEESAIEMLAQHIITKPIFEALFEDYSFEQNNVVSRAMHEMLSQLEGKTVAEESETLQRFYDSVRARVQGIDNAEGKQKVINELYDTFFKTAFPKMADQLGIVYTPIEVVDFIIHSLDAVLKKEFGRSLSDENVHILDPFVGTGTFITRLLQSGLIRKEDLERKYQYELHANEIVLLAYYIAAVNIENVFHDRLGEGSEYKPFEGIVLTDTFQLGETDGALLTEALRLNSERVERQKKTPLTVIMANPPYSAGQTSANDDAANQKYTRLDARIAETYAKETDAVNKNSLYDSYIRAFRWSTDRLDPEHGGVIAFVSNGMWLDSNSADGFRKTIEREFSGIWVFNLRGNARTQGELRRKEAGNVFGEGTRTPVAITLLVKKPKTKSEKAKVYYHDIGDYLSREEKLAIIKEFGAISNPKMKWKKITPNEHGDWINQRSGIFDEFIPLGDKSRKSNEATFFVPHYSNGLKTQRDAWCYNSSEVILRQNIARHIAFYNEQVEKISHAGGSNEEKKRLLDRNPRRISWTRALENNALRGKTHYVEDGTVVTALYRPFFKQYLYFSPHLNEMVYQIPRLFPSQETDNRVICVSAKYTDGTVIMTDLLPDLHINGDSQCFPLYYYDERSRNQLGLFDEPGCTQYVRRDGISDFILMRATEQYGKNVTKEDIFYYVYGFLHSQEYRERFANDLKRMLPRLPLVKDRDDFWAFSNAGRRLADLHIHYESVPAHPDVVVNGAELGNYRVEKMRFRRVKVKVDGKDRTVDDKSTIHYNSTITISNIPDKAYEYVVNGRSAIEWIMDRYQVRTDKKSGITNDPNGWAEEVGNPRYILDLLLSVINVSVQTVDIVDNLPRLKFD